MGQANVQPTVKFNHTTAHPPSSTGIALDFGTAFGIVMVASVVGMSLQYWAARYLFKDKVRHFGHPKTTETPTHIRVEALRYCSSDWHHPGSDPAPPDPALLQSFGLEPCSRCEQVFSAAAACTNMDRALTCHAAGRAAPAAASQGWHICGSACSGHCWALEGRCFDPLGPFTLCCHELHLCESQITFWDHPSGMAAISMLSAILPC